MKQFLSANDADDPLQLAREAIEIKKDPYEFSHLGENKVLGLIFFNPSLRTRMSMVRAAYNLGMKVITLNVTSDSWQLETEEGAVMDKGHAEHVREAAAVMGSYCDILGVRSFPGLRSREEDYAEKLITSFRNYGNVPLINMESASLHPLQSLADLMTIKEFAGNGKPKIVLTWAPHVKSLPQSVANSFAQWIIASNMDLTITHPEEMELSSEFTAGATIEYDQEKAFQSADFIYVKNWSSYKDYGKLHKDSWWMVDERKLALTNNARLMHCLPVRRNVVITDGALDSNHSIVIRQAENRIYSAQVVLKKILEAL